MAGTIDQIPTITTGNFALKNGQEDNDEDVSALVSALMQLVNEIRGGTGNNTNTASIDTSDPDPDRKRVKDSYKNLLGRAPENKEVVDYWTDRARDGKNIEEEMMKSSEYKQNQGGQNQGMLDKVVQILLRLIVSLLGNKNSETSVSNNAAQSAGTPLAGFTSSDSPNPNFVETQTGLGTGAGSRNYVTDDKTKTSLGLSGASA